MSKALRSTTILLALLFSICSLVAPSSAVAQSAADPDPDPVDEVQQPITAAANPNCKPRCGTVQCGPDGCGGLCGSCRRGASCVSGRCVDGAIDVSVEYTGLVGDIFPTFIAHLLGTGPLQDIPLVQVNARNLSESDRVPLSVEVHIPGFSTAGKSTVNLKPGESRVLSLTPTLDFTALSKITTSTPSAINVTIHSSSSMIFEETRRIKLASKNSMFWTFPDSQPDMTQPRMKRDHPLAPYLCAWVVPHDKDFLMRKLLKSASEYMPVKAMVGYQDVPLPAMELTELADAEYVVERVHPGAGNSIRVQLVGPPDAPRPDVVFQVMDDANLALWKSGGEALAYVAQTDAAAAGEITFKADAEIDYNLLYSRGPGYVAGSRVARVRDATHMEIVAMQTAAIFNAMKAMGINYVNAPNDFFATSQFIMYPTEVFQNKTANCAEGALVFASAFKALGLRAVLYLVPGHMFVGVRTWTDEDTILPIETTMVGTGTAEDAIDAAMEQVGKLGADDMLILDVDQMAGAGVVPWPM